MQCSGNRPAGITMAEADTSVIRTVGLTKIFRDFWLRAKVTAVSDLDLDIRPREVFGLLGPNGSGKSTTLKIILGLLFPTRGKVAVFGKRATDVAIKSRIGFLPEESYLYPFLDAYETLDFYGKLFQQPRQMRRKRIEMLLEMVGLKGAAFRRVGEYSKGMQRRIGLAQALINDPDLLILDEPTSGLDPIGTSQIKDIIKTLARRGKTVLLSSHLLADVEDVCDRVSILYGGKQRELGTIDDLLSQQGLTQIVTDELDDATLARVDEVVREAGKEVHSVTAPRDKLESLFLRVVADAQSRRMVTGGAVGGGRVAEFLTADAVQAATGQAVIEHLVAVTRKDDAPAQADQMPVETPETRLPVVDQDVLSNLFVAADGAGQPPDEPAPAPKDAPSTSGPDSRPQRQADQSILDDLLASDPDTEDS